MKDNSVKNKWVSYESVKGNPFFDEDGRLKVDDRVLVNKYLKGDEYERSCAESAINYYHGNKVLKILLESYKKDDAENTRDSLQEALLQMFSQLKQYRGGSLEIWLLTKVNSIILNSKKNSPDPEIHFDDFDLEIQDNSSNPSEKLKQDQEKKLIHDLKGKHKELVKSLSDPCRLTLKVLFLDKWRLEYEADEITLIARLARKSQYPEDTVEQVFIRIASIREKLYTEHEKLNKEEDTIDKLLTRIAKDQESLRIEESKTLDDKIDRMQDRRDKFFLKKRLKGNVIKTKYKDIAYILGIPIGTVGSNVHELNKEIRKLSEQDKGSK